MEQALVTFIATSFNEPWFNRAFINSIIAQTDNSNFKAIVFNNGPSTVEAIDKQIQEDIHLDCLIYKESKINTDNWGTVNRQTGIEECETEYIIQTSIQDYWLPQAVEYINKALIEYSPDILIWNSINHLTGLCEVLDAQLAWSKIDWGNFAIKTDIAKKIGIKHGDQFCADWLFIKDCIDSGLVKNVKKINGVLTIHN